MVLLRARLRRMKTARPSLDIPLSWKPALEAARAGGTLFLIGATDSGKSTLAAVLANEARASGRRVAVVDADMGQSSIGPPACVGMALVEQEIGCLEELSPAAVDFVGASSPVGHLLQAATSVAAMARAAREDGADTLIVDTTGLVSGGIARALKGAKIRLLDPEVVIALQEENEAEHLLVPYRARTRPRVVALPVSKAVRARSREERAANRQRKLGAYLAAGRVVELSWDKAPVENSAWTSGEPLPGHMCAYAEECVACEVLHAERRADGVFLIVRGQPEPVGLRKLAGSFGGTARAVEAASLANLLVGLLGARGETVALGILEVVDYRRRCTTVYTPLEEIEAVKGVRLGAIQLARDGTQLAAGEPGVAG
jgi:polynucleotide 5'-hydroxyl-kinase GRC3/NOL9